MCRLYKMLYILYPIILQCQPPKDVCIYEHQHAPSTKSGIKSGRRKSSKHLKSIEKRSVKLPQLSVVKVYTLNDTWKDGPCLECNDFRNFSDSENIYSIYIFIFLNIFILGKCEYEFNVARSVCTTQQCPDAIDDDYILKAEQDPDELECCPRLIRTACQLETRIFKVISILSVNKLIHLLFNIQAGEEWPAPGGDPCKSYVCQELSDGTVVKQLHVQTCTTTCPDVRSLGLISMIVKIYIQTIINIL